MGLDSGRKGELGLIYPVLSERVIGCFYTVYNALGYGFLEKVYENALSLELRTHGFSVKQQAPITVYYGGEIVGDYFADILVENKILLELKTAEKIGDAHKLQLLNYLKASHAKVGYILNFGSKPNFKRIIYTKSPSTKKSS